VHAVQNKIFQMKILVKRQLLWEIKENLFLNMGGIFELTILYKWLMFLSVL